jgi:hypothetical protein
MLGHEPDHQSQRPRLGADLDRQGGRERAVHRREPGVCALWICPVTGGRGRQLEPFGAEGWLSQGSLEWECNEIDQEGWMRGVVEIWEGRLTEREGRGGLFKQR